MDRHEVRKAITGGDDPLELRTWNRLRTCTGRIATLLAQRLRSEYGMNPARLDLLGHLHQAPEGLAMTALARRLMVTNASVTGLVDRMETEGLVERRPSPADRRRTLIAATRTGTCDPCGGCFGIHGVAARHLCRPPAQRSGAALCKPGVDQRSRRSGERKAPTRIRAVREQVRPPTGPAAHRVRHAEGHPCRIHVVQSARIRQMALPAESTASRMSPA